MRVRGIPVIVVSLLQRVPVLWESTNRSNTWASSTFVISVNIQQPLDLV